MILLVKQKTKCYKKFEKDIWGLGFNEPKGHRFTNFWTVWLFRFFYRLRLKRKRYWWSQRGRFLYILDKPFIFKKKIRLKKKWITIRLVRIYFLTIKDHQFRCLFKKASKLDGNLESNYCYLLEGRILHIFYRTNFLTDLFWIMDFIKNGNVLLNKNSITFYNIIVNIGTFITFKNKWKKYLYTRLKKRAKIRALLFNTPKYLHISYRLLYAILLRKPQKTELVYKVPLDIQRITGYY